MHLFSLGLIEITPAASAALAATEVDPALFLDRYQRGDWGEKEERRRQINDLAVQNGSQIDSTYRLSDDTELMLSTAADRSCTRILLATEYEHREVGTQEGYRRWAASYDTGPNPLIAVEEPQVDSLIARLPITSALDVGTGTGRHALKLARRGATVVAIDQSAEMLAMAQQAAQREGVTIDFQQIALEEGLPFEAGQFDFLICGLVLCHVPNLIQSMREFDRVLQPAGHLVITDFHPDAMSLGWRTIYERPGITYYLPNMSHTRADYLEALAATGFTILNIIDVPIRDVPHGILSDTLIRTHGDRLLCLIVFAQKGSPGNQQAGL